MEPPKPIHTIVLDAGPLLLNQPSISTLLAKSDRICTTPTVVEEIRDEDARNRLETLVKPFLTIRAPNQASLKTVSEFARKTGDLAVLSSTDLHVFALAYELECEQNHGDWRLRKTPGQKGLNGSPPQAVQQKAPNRSSELLTDNEEYAAVSHVKETYVARDQEGQHARAVNDKAEPKLDHIQTLDVATEFSKLALHSTPEQDGGPGKAGDQLPNPDVDQPASQDDSGDSDSEGWITPSNIKKRQQEDAGLDEVEEARQTTLQVATLTTDFALQNSLMLMNLNIISPSISRVSHLRSHILRCHACFATTKEMNRQFCQRCGMPTLTRVSCSTTPRGGFKLHLKKNMQWNTRGDRYSVPKPVGGTSSGKTGRGGRGKGGKGGWGKELLLAEDQKEYVRAVASESKRKEKNLMDEDYLPRILTGERGSGGKVRVGAGRNVNSRKR